VSHRAVPLPSVRGNLGLLPGDPRDVALYLPFHEPAGVLPSDASGNLGDLGAVIDGAKPGDGIFAVAAAAEGWASRGRKFSPGGRTILVGKDAPGRSTLLTRDVSVQAIVTVSAVGSSMPIVTRGLGFPSDASEHCAFGLELGTSGISSAVGVRWHWQAPDGAVRTQTDAPFDVPLGEPVLLTATRRWERSDRVVLRYYVDETLLAEVVSADGEIGGGTTGQTAVGGRRLGLNKWAFFGGVIDQLLVVRYEMAHDEVRATWRRLSMHQPAGVETVRALVPPGAPWTRDPASRIGRRLRLAGQAIGLAVANAEELRATWLPDAADRATLGRWERLCGLAARPLDSLDVRRARVLSFLARENGLSLPALRTALAEPFDLPADQVGIVELSNTITDTFDQLKAERWSAEPVDAWSVADNTLRLSRPQGTDLRWDGRYRAPCLVRTPLESADELAVVARVTAHSVPSDAVAGLMLFNRRSMNALWLGVRSVGGAPHVGYVQYRNGAMSGFFSLLSSALVPLWLGVIRRGPESYDLCVSVTSPETWTVTARVSTGIPDPEYAGFGAVGTDAGIASTLSMSFADFSARTPQARRPFRWFAHRDLSLPGAPDLTGAGLLVRSIRPAHTEATVITSRSLVCDTAGHGCDAGPMGAL
jgi:hypothetical protein